MLSKGPKLGISKFTNETVENPTKTKSYPYLPH